MRRHRTITLAAAIAGLLAASDIAAAQSKIYPPGTACANLATIAERLLCGRQEYRREQGLSVVQPTIVPEGSAPASVDEPDPIPAPPAPAELVPPSGRQIESQMNTASPKH
jgi:hypothetical protein